MKLADAGSSLASERVLSVDAAYTALGAPGVCLELWAAPIQLVIWPTTYQEESSESNSVGGNCNTKYVDMKGCMW